MQLPHKPIRRNFLEMVICNLCEHPPTRRLLLSCLLSLVHHIKPGTTPLDIAKAVVARAVRAQGGGGSAPDDFVDMGGPSSTATPTAVEFKATSSVLDVLATVARLGSVRLFLFRTTELSASDAEPPVPSESKAPVEELDSKEDDGDAVMKPAAAAAKAARASELGGGETWTLPNDGREPGTTLGTWTPRTGPCVACALLLTPAPLLVLLTARLDDARAAVGACPHAGPACCAAEGHPR